MAKRWGMGEPCDKEDRFGGKEVENVIEIVRKEWEGGVRGGIDLFDGNGGNEGFDVRNGTVLGWG